MVFRTGLAVVASVLFVGGATAQETTADQRIAVDAVLACLENADPADRHACFDNAVPGLALAFGRPQSPVAEAPADVETPVALSSTETAPGPEETTVVAAAEPAIPEAPRGPAIPAAPSVAAPEDEPEEGRFALFGLLGERASRKPETFGEEQVATREEKTEKDSETLRATAIEVLKDRNGDLYVILDNGQHWRQLSSDGGFRRLPREETPAVSISQGALSGYRLKFDGVKGRIRVRRVK